MIKSIVPKTSIKIRRLLLGIKQVELANILGISVSTMSKIECGKLRIDERQREVAAIVLRCSPKDLDKPPKHVKFNEM